MGNIRTPKPIYKDGSVMEFYVRKNQIMYSIKIWSKDGTNQSLLKVGILGNKDASEVLEKELQFRSMI